MPWEYWTPSIVRPVVSFAGASVRSFTEHSILFPPEIDEPAFRVEWDHEGTGGRLSHSIVVRPPQTGEVFSLSEALRRRLFCHAILGLLPENALPEACESLAGIYEFYRSLPIAPMPALPRPEPTAAKWGETYERPPFHLAED